MSRPRWALAAGALALSTAAGAERVVDYSLGEAKAAEDAAAQGAPFTPLPKRGSLHVAVEVAPEVDHEVVRGGTMCSVWKIRNPMRSLVEQFVAAWDRDGRPAAQAGPTTDVAIKVSRATTLSRCVSTGELKAGCITRVAISGTVTGRDRVARPFRVERESAAHSAGICAGLARAVGVVSRAAAAAMIEAVAAPAAPAPAASVAPIA